MDCDGCTLCCTLCNVPELNKAAGEPCKFNTGTGCSNYDERPYSCREFRCAYHQAGNDKALRPDNCGVVFERIGNTMYGSADTTRTNYPHVNGQIKAFIKQGVPVVMKKGDKIWRSQPMTQT